MNISTQRPILLVGGDRDPNIACLDASLRRRQLPVRTVLVGHQHHPRVHWNLADGGLLIDDRPVRPGALFIRHDVFGSLIEERPEPSQRSLSWYITLTGWALANPDVRWLNRASAREGTNKVEALLIAQECGLPIPATWITNDHDWLEAKAADDPIVKPVGGGAFTQTLRQVISTVPRQDGALPAPAFIQEQLVSPELRLFQVAGQWLAFQVDSEAIDYRNSPDTQLMPLAQDTIPAHLIEGQAELMRRLRLDYGAADYKSSALDGEYRFLEINNGAMFAAFDTVSDGAVTRAIGDFLAGTP